MPVFRSRSMTVIFEVGGPRSPPSPTYPLPSKTDRSSSVRSDDPACSREEMDDEGDDREHDQQMDQSAGDVEREQAQRPCHEQYQTDGEKHDLTSTPR